MSWPASWGPVRTPTLATGGMVVSSSPAVSVAGARVLADGGTAVDAVLAMTAMSWLALPGQCGIGGDFFAVSGSPTIGIVAAFQRDRRRRAKGVILLTLP